MGINQSARYGEPGPEHIGDTCIALGQADRPRHEGDERAAKESEREGRA